MANWVKKQAPVSARAAGAKTISVTINNVAQGSLIPIVIGLAAGTTNPTAISVSDSLGDFVYRIVPANLNGNVPDLALYHLANVAAGNHTITVNLGNTDNCNIDLIVGPEWAGGVALDVSSVLSAITSGATVTAPSITTNAGSDLILFLAAQGGAANTYSAFNNSFALEANQTGGPCTFLADEVQTSPGAIQGQCTSSVTSTWISAQAAFLLSTGLTISKIDNGDSGVNSNSVTQVSLKRNHYIQAGDLLVAIVLGNQNNNISSVSDGQLGNLITGGNASEWSPTISSYAQVYWTIAGQNFNASNTNFLTVNFSSGTRFAEVIYAQFRPAPSYAFYPVATLLASSVASVQVNPGTGVGAITSTNANVPQSPIMAFGFSINETGNTGPTDDNAAITNSGVNTFTANNGNMRVSFGVVSSTGNQSMLWTDSSGGATNTYISMFLTFNVSNPQAMPLFFREEFNRQNIAGPPFSETSPSGVSLLTTVPLTPPFTPPEYLTPISRNLHIAVTTTAQQQQEIVGAPLYGQDRVLVPNRWDYRWRTGLEAMPVALRSDYEGLTALVLASTLFTLPVGVTDQAYTGLRVLAPPSYEFPMPLPIFGKDSTTGGVGAPFLNIDWVVPPDKLRAFSVHDIMQSMLALKTFVPPMPPINQEDWPVPLSPRRSVQDWTQGIQSTGLGQLLTFPFGQVDWPNPIQARYAISLRQFEQTPNLSVLQQISSPPPGQALSPDWPNPLIAKRSTELLGISLFNIPLFSAIPVSGGHVGRIVFPAKRLSDIAGLPFDFISALAPGETIVSATVTVSMYSGVDSNPSAILNAAPITVGTVATQFVGKGNSAVGNIYTVLCQATSSLSKQYTMAGYLAVEPDVP